MNFWYLDNNFVWILVIVVSIEGRILPYYRAFSVPGGGYFGNPLIYNGHRPHIFSHHPSNSHSPLILTGYHHPSNYPIGNSAGIVYPQGTSVDGSAYFQHPQYVRKIKQNMVQVPPGFRSANYDGDVFHAQQAPTVEPQVDPNEDVHRQYHNNNMDGDSVKPEISNRLPHPDPPSQKSKTNKKVLIETEEEESDDDYDNDDATVSANRRDKGISSINHYFPMVFSFTKSSDRSSGGPVMAVANSYSTGKTGVASSVATAYGGSRTRKQQKCSKYSQ